MRRNRIIAEDLEYINKQNINWNLFRNKTVFISGANGFLPAYMVESLLYLNELDPTMNIKVIGLVRNKEKAQNRFSFYQNRKDLSFITQDVSLPVQIDGPVDYIIHAASQASPKYFEKDPVGTLKANTIGTINLLELARTKNIKGFLFFSSGEVYGIPNENDLPLKESFNGNVNQLDLRSCYAESKRMGENMCISWYSQYNIPCKIIRLFHTYGPGLDLNDKRVMADFVENIVNNKNIIMRSNGSATRPFCYIADAIVGFFTILLKGNTGEAYNVGAETEVSILQLAQTLINLYPSKNLKLIKYDEKREKEEYMQSPISRILPDISKMKKLGWYPKFTIEQGFRRTIESYLE